MMNRARVLIVLAFLVLFAVQAVHGETIPAQEMIPVNLGLASDEVQAQLPVTAMPLSSSSSSTTPRTLSEMKKDILDTLPNSDMFVFVLDGMKANEVGLTILAGQDSSKYTIIVQEYSVYRNNQDAITKKWYRFGVSVRMLLIVRERVSKLNTLSIAAIAAQTERRKLESQIRIEVIGISGQAVTEATPMPSELTFTTLMNMYQCMDRIKAAIHDEVSLLHPQVLAYGK